MGILKRFKDIMSANINALLDKAEDPEKMIDQYLEKNEKNFAVHHVRFSCSSHPFYGILIKTNGKGGHKICAF